ncbi:MAG TPA: transporter [Ferruginibacter sp.]|nr:transporter [Ferruginibacter sp.]
MNIKLLVLPILLFYGSSYAQSNKIDTDRPDQSESVNTVPKNWIQFELGFLKQSDKHLKHQKEIMFQHPALLTKYGLTKNFELRLITTYGTDKQKDSNTVSNRKTGLQSVQVGGKLNFLKEKGLRPKTSLIAHYDLRRLQTPYSDTIDGANFRFTMQHTLSPIISLSYNLGMEWERFGKPPAYIYTFTPGIDISEKWYSYVELFGAICKNEKPDHNVAAGLAWLVMPDLKLDISAGKGISKAAPDWYMAVGGSFRFKIKK